MVENYGNMKAELDAKCESYESENQRLLRTVEELQTQTQVSRKIIVCLCERWFYST